MATIYLDELGINNYVKSGLNNAVQNLKNVTNYSSQMNIPQDFIYKDYLNNFHSFLNKDYSITKEINDKILSTITDLKKINIGINSKLLSISNYKVTRRISAIK